MGSDNSKENFVYVKFNTAAGLTIYRQALEEFDIRWYGLGVDKIGVQSKDYDRWYTRFMRAVCLGSKVDVPDGAILKKQYGDNS